MPTPTILPLRARAARVPATRVVDADFAAYDDAPRVLSFQAARARQLTTETLDRSDSARLLREALDLARRFGCEVRRRRLGGFGGGCRWIGGRRRVVLDLDATTEARLAVVADSLRGEPRLPYQPMSQELAEYLRPTRVA